MNGADGDWGLSDAASGSQTVAEAHSALRARDDIQFELPHAPPAPPPTKPMQFPEVSATFFWVLVAMGAAFLLYIIVRAVVDREPKGKPLPTAEQDVAKWRPEEKAARALLAEADAMAEAGRYEEAARLLLHRSLEDIAKRKPKLLRPALTSREIGRAPLLPDAVRAAFDAMADPVERSLFGGRSLDRSAWESARAAYGDFALPKAWS